MPTHTTKKIYKKPYIGPDLLYKQTKIQSLFSPYQTKNGLQRYTKKPTFNETHVIIHFILDTIIYTEPTIPTELNKESHIEPFSFRILCIHQKNTTIDILDLETKLLQITTNKPPIHNITTSHSIQYPSLQAPKMEQVTIPQAF
jgi:hypothetical protein